MPPAISLIQNALRPASRVRTLALAAALAIGIADAAPTPELVVTGTRLAAAEAELPSVTTVLDEQEIEARGDSTAIDLFRGLAGVHVTQPGAGGVPQLFMRGGEPNFTVFMIDGIKVNDPNNTRGGSFDLSSINLMDVERVEIVRGPQSSIYGSDGLSGVINVISKGGGEDFAAVVEGEGGGDDFVRGALQLSGPAGTGGYSVQFTSRDDGEAVEGSTYEADTVSGRLRMEPTDAVTANLYGRFADTEGTSFPEQSGGPEFAVLRDLDEYSSRDLSVGADFDWALSPTVNLQGLISRYDRRDEYTSPGIAPFDQVPPNGAHNDLARDNASLRVTGRTGDWLTTTVGVDFQREDGESVGYIDFAPDVRVPNDFALDRSIYGLFAEGRAVVSDGLLLQASLRHDAPDEVSGRTTGRVGAIVTPDHGTTRFHANWGTGFKLPSFFALGSPIVGEPDLKPEKSRSVDVGVSRRVGANGELSLSYFYNEYVDLIDFDQTTFKSVNRDEVTAEGIEAGGLVAIGAGMELRAHATWADIDVHEKPTLTDPDPAPRELLQRPELRGGLGWRWNLNPQWTVDLDWLYVDDVLDNSLPTGEVTLDDYHRVDLNVGWQATPRLRFAFAVDNLLDAEYQEAVGFPAAGIRPRLSARYRFGGN